MKTTGWLRPLLVAIGLATMGAGTGCTVRGSYTATARVRTPPPPPPGSVVVDVTSRPGYSYINGHWELVGEHWVWRDGYWTRARPGYAYNQGRWVYDGGYYRWVPGTWEPAPSDHEWRPGRWENRGGVSVWIEGRWAPRRHYRDDDRYRRRTILR